MLIPRFKMQRTLILVVAFLAAASMSALAAHAQSKESRFSNDDLQVRVTPADRDAAGRAVQGSRHLNYARTPAGIAAHNHADFTRIPAAKPPDEDEVGNGWTQNPGDVAYLGGMVVQHAVSHAVYVNPGGACTIASCWGDPEGFLADLFDSDFIHLTDEYTGQSDDRRYTVGARFVLKDALASNVLYESDLVAILHSVVMTSGEAGYGNIYHLFLPPGVDTCFDPPNESECYSPDNPATFSVCAYHDYVTFTDLGQHVLFTVEPWQGASGCVDSPTGAPNGQLADSTNDTLNHETFETISDPDVNAWLNDTNAYLDGLEIADECEFFSNGYQTDPTFRINGKVYRVQSIYSNRKHTCAISPQYF
jgi:hypothetical protein